MRDIPVVIKADVSSVEDTWDITKKPGDDQELSESGSGQNITVASKTEVSIDFSIFEKKDSSFFPRRSILKLKPIKMRRPHRPPFGGYRRCDLPPGYSEEDLKKAKEACDLGQEDTTYIYVYDEESNEEE